MGISFDQFPGSSVETPSQESPKIAEFKALMEGMSDDELRKVSGMVEAETEARQQREADRMSAPRTIEADGVSVLIEGDGSGSATLQLKGEATMNVAFTNVTADLLDELTKAIQEKVSAGVAPKQVAEILTRAFEGSPRFGGRILLRQEIIDRIKG